VRGFYISRTTHFARKSAAKTAVVRAIRAARRSAPSLAPAPPAPSPVPPLQPTFALKLVLGPTSSISQFDDDLAIADDMHPETIYITSSNPNVDVRVA
jgi:hypothetical protein